MKISSKESELSREKQRKRFESTAGWSISASTINKFLLNICTERENATGMHPALAAASFEHEQKSHYAAASAFLSRSLVGAH
jgi:hypothetical protein